MPAERFHSENGTAVLCVGHVEEVDLARRILAHVLEIGLGLANGAMNSWLELGIEAERLREAAVFGGDYLAAWIERQKVVLDGLGLILSGESSRGFAGS